MLINCKKALFTLGAAALAMSLQVSAGQAATITHGLLSSDDQSGIIVDAANGFEYTRLDAFDLTVADTIAATATGGAYEGWSILDATQADRFVEAILGNAITSSPCSSNGSSKNMTYCGTISGWTDGDFGASHRSDYDFFAYTDAASSMGLGLMRIFADGRMRQETDWGSATNLDPRNLGDKSAINLMLFRDAPRIQLRQVRLLQVQSNVNPVPLPATGLMLAGALAGFGLMRCRRKAT